MKQESADTHRKSSIPDIDIIDLDFVTNEEKNEESAMMVYGKRLWAG